MLKVNNISTYYGNIQALKGVSLEVQEGEIVTLIGANGAGKTTTLMSLCGIVPPRSAFGNGSYITACLIQLPAFQLRVTRRRFPV